MRVWSAGVRGVKGVKGEGKTQLRFVKASKVRARSFKKVCEEDVVK
jgi:hypothetical protein